MCKIFDKNIKVLTTILYFLTALNNHALKKKKLKFMSVAAVSLHSVVD